MRTRAIIQKGLDVDSGSKWVKYKIERSWNKLTPDVQDLSPPSLALRRSSELIPSRVQFSVLSLLMIVARLRSFTKTRKTNLAIKSGDLAPHQSSNTRAAHSIILMITTVASSIGRMSFARPQGSSCLSSSYLSSSSSDHL